MNCRSRRRPIFILWSLILMLAVPALWGQGRTSSISGVVNDESGAVLPGVTVTVRQVDTGITRTVLTDEQGLYRVPLLGLGEYEVSASLPGFKTFHRRGITLTLDREAVINLTLTVGEISEEVTVSGEAPLVDTTSSGLANLVDGKEIRDLPLNGRDYIQLATLQPGIHVARAQGSGTNTGQGVKITIAGSRPVQNNFRLDGTSVSDYTGSTPGSVNGVNLGVDAIQEFSVLSSTYSAQYGRAAGGTINVVTRSGTNDYHGTLFYFHRNDNLDARNFFDVGAPPEFRRHQYGAALGGPIATDKTFFFVNYEGLREARGNTTINTTISDEARAGRLTSGNVSIDPAVLPYLAFYPRPNGQVLGDTGLFIFSDDLDAKEDFLVGRIDHVFSDTDSLFGRYTLDDADRLDESSFAINSNTDATRSQYVTLEETHIFSPGLLNALRFGFTRFFNINGVTNAQLAGVDDPNLAFVPTQSVVGVIVITGLSDFPGGSGATDSDINAFNSFQLFDDVTWNRGSHSLKIGGVMERMQFNADSQNRQSGEYRFRSVRDFLTNRPRDFRSQLPGSDTKRGWRQWLAGWYLQDDWKLARNFTLNLGIRHEFTTVPTEVNGKIANIDEVTSPTTRVGDPFYDNPSWDNFAPRIGFAWDPFSNGRTAIRGGYGIFHDQLLVQFLIIPGVRTPPFFLRADTVLGPGDFPDNGFPTIVNSPNPELRAERLPRDMNQPYVQQWNLNLQQDIGLNMVATIGYVGSHGVHLTAIVEDANLRVPEILPDGRRFFPANGQKLNSNFGLIRDRLFDGHSFYHALQLSLRKRWSHGLQFQNSYTFAKSIDDDSSTFSHDEASNAIGIPVNGDHRFNRGLSNHDVRHNFVFNATWDLPSPSGDSALRLLFGGWQLGSIFSHSTGLPFTATLSYDAARTGTTRPNRQGGQRPDLAPGQSNNPVTGDPNRWFDPAAFARPEPGFLGNLGRNTLTGPGFTNLDFTLVKRIALPALGEEGRLDFRVEFFNILNHPNFSLPSPGRMEVFSASAIPEDVGRITSAEASREIQFGMKIFF